MLLYTGAVLGSVSLPGRSTPRETRLRWTHAPRLVAIAFFGAALAPSLFAWGLQRVSASYGSLLLNAEAVFTVVLAAVIHREQIGGRVALAVVLMASGGAVTVGAAALTSTGATFGALAILAAVFAWALDNVLTRPFADLDPAAVVRTKALSGAAMTLVLALACAESAPQPSSALGLLACGATGYGLSLRLYLLAQRRIGAGRTGSVFALAPFVGLGVALALGEQPAAWATALAAVLFLAGLWLHLTEKHEHLHTHEPLIHEHAHRHDDGHHAHPHEEMPDGSHAHPHEEMPDGSHAHPHTHEAMTHAHPHGPDTHHSHSH